jgi:hypothetical protein
MWFSRITTAFALLIWGYFALAGLGAMSDIAAQHAPGYPNAGQRNYYLYIPLAMAAISLALAAAAWFAKKNLPIGCAALATIAAWFVYIITYSGGI